MPSAAEAAGQFPVRLDDGAEIQVRHLGKGPRIIVSHGNGFAIDAYREFWTLLSERHEVVMFDFRHHGRSTPFKAPVRNWPQFIRDFDTTLTAIGSRLGNAPTVGAFHSMSALTALLHAAQHAFPWKGIVAFEPPVPPPVGHPLAAALFKMYRELAEGAERRRSTFPDVETLVTSFASREAYRRLDRQALHQLAASTLRQRPDGTYELACERSFEAETFRLRCLDDTWRRVCSVNVPVMIVAGLPDANEDHCLRDLAHAIASEAGFEFAEIVDATHLLQLEHAAACAMVVERFIKSRG